MHRKSEYSKKYSHSTRLKQNNYRLIFKEADEKCLDCEQERRKFVSHHVPPEDKKQVKLTRNSVCGTFYAPSIRKKDCREHNKQNNLLVKIKEIESIRNVQQKRPILKKKLVRFRQKQKNSRSKPENNQEKVQQDSFQRLKTLNDVLQKVKKRQKSVNSVFIPLKLQQNSIEQEVELLIKQKPNRLFNFIEGFPERFIENQFSSDECYFSLHKFGQKINKSAILSAIFKEIGKNGRLDVMKDQELRPNFVSMARTYQYAQKNGFRGQYLKKIMKLSNCV